MQRLNVMTHAEIDLTQTTVKKILTRTHAVVIDHFIEGDGTPDGRRTMQTALPQSMTLVNPASTRLEYRNRILQIARRRMPCRVGVSADGFSGHYE